MSFENIKKGILMSDDYQYTQDWFHWAPEVWTQLATTLPERQAFLEIGSFEGRSTVWTIENMMEDGAFIDCLDTWEGGAEHTNGEMSGAEQRFDHNMELVAEKYAGANYGGMRRVRKYKGPSAKSLAVIYSRETDRSIHTMGDPRFATIRHGDEHCLAPQYDFIYIDGSHRAKDVLTDACMAWPMLKKDGIMVFDDYAWGPPRDVLYRPKIAIDAFTTMFAEEAQIVFSGYQLVVRKTV